MYVKLLRDLLQAEIDISVMRILEWGNWPTPTAVNFLCYGLKKLATYFKFCMKVLNLRQERSASVKALTQDKRCSILFDSARHLHLLENTALFIYFILQIARETGRA